MKRLFFFFALAFSVLTLSLPALSNQMVVLEIASEKSPTNSNFQHLSIARPIRISTVPGDSIHYKNAIQKSYLKNVVTTRNANGVVTHEVERDKTQYGISVFVEVGDFDPKTQSIIAKSELAIFDLLQMNRINHSENHYSELPQFKDEKLISSQELSKSNPEATILKYGGFIYKLKLEDF